MESVILNSEAFFGGALPGPAVGTHRAPGTPWLNLGTGPQGQGMNTKQERGRKGGYGKRGNRKEERTEMISYLQYFLFPTSSAGFFVH